MTPELDSAAVTVSRSRSWTDLLSGRPSHRYSPLIPSIQTGQSRTFRAGTAYMRRAHGECAAWIRSATARAVSMGTAKPVWRSPLPVRATLISMASPDRFTRGPPVSSPPPPGRVDTSRRVSRWPPGRVGLAGQHHARHRPARTLDRLGAGQHESRGGENDPRGRPRCRGPPGCAPGPARPSSGCSPGCPPRCRRPRRTPCFREADWGLPMRHPVVPPVTAWPASASSRGSVPDSAAGLPVAAWSSLGPAGLLPAGPLAAPGSCSLSRPCIGAS